MRSSENTGTSASRRQSRRAEAVSPDLTEFLGMLDALELRMAAETATARD